MTVQTILEESALDLDAPIGRCDLADGRLVRLAGPIGLEHLDGLRSALLTPLPAGCRDIVVDAGDVESISDDAVAILLAGAAWANDHDARLLLSRVAEVVDDTLDELDIAHCLPRLAALGATGDVAPDFLDEATPAAAQPLVPRPRVAVD